jgi:hypothetical protein
MVALFQYSPIDILSVSLPPLVLDLTGDVPQECIRREARVVGLFLVKICCWYFHTKLFVNVLRKSILAFSDIWQG